MKSNKKFPDQKFSDLISDYLKQNELDQTPVINPLPYKELKKEIDLSLHPDGCTTEELYEFIKSYINNSVRTGHKQFYNQLWSGFTIPGFLGEVFTSLTNTSMYTYEAAPVATILETEIIHKMGKLIGYKNPDGILGTGGSNGNLMALLIARNHYHSDFKKKGMLNGNNYIVFVSDQAHYSFEKAANVIGIGEDQVFKIKSDRVGRMIPEELERAIEEVKFAGKIPFFVAATAGTTVKGAFDPCSKISDIAQNHNIWFHVDGSLGGSVLLSEKNKHLLEGCENSDSFVWNAHKAMGLPLICSALIVREPGHLIRTFSTSGTDYLFHDNDSAIFDIGPKSLQCGRKVDSLKLWLAWKYYGDNGFCSRIDKFFSLSKYAENIIENNPNLELMAPLSSVNICFRYTSPHIKDLNTFNLILRNELARRGKCLVNYAHIEENLVIRLVILNHESEKEDIDLFFKNLLETAAEIS